MARVSFTRHLQRFFPGIDRLEVDATTVAEVIDGLERSFPGIRGYLLDDAGALRQHVNIFIGESLVSDRKTLGDQLDADDEIYIMQALSGG